MKLVCLTCVSHNCNVERSRWLFFFLNKIRTIIQFKIILYRQKCVKSQLIKNRWSPEHAGAIFFVSLVQVEEERFRLLHLLAGCH